MKLRITTALAGATFSYAAGDVVELPDAEAAKLVAANFAEPVKATRSTKSSRLETAVTPDLIPLETATNPNA